MLLSVLSTDREDRTVEVRAELIGDQRDDAQMEAAVSRLSLEPSVSSVRWEAVPA
ncbi:hypothetical protein [Amycolatopsis balhimycina]|uniref:hypothetical protein n=1 Tax=Amycolatopsis balhimycina TaxID=208443 RepID=UPI000364D05C|nr:hypothetical protein [Amycolatopsis balhimycina]